MSDDRPSDRMAPNAASRFRESQAECREQVGPIHAEQGSRVAAHVAACGLL